MAPPETEDQAELKFSELHAHIGEEKDNSAEVIGAKSKAQNEDQEHERSRDEEQKLVQDIMNLQIQDRHWDISSAGQNLTPPQPKKIVRILGPHCLTLPSIDEDKAETDHGVMMLKQGWDQDHLKEWESTNKKILESLNEDSKIMAQQNQSQSKARLLIDGGAFRHVAGLSLFSFISGRRKMAMD